MIAQPARNSLIQSLDLGESQLLSSINRIEDLRRKCLKEIGRTDEMCAYFISNQPSIAESKFISAINTRIISYVNGDMSIAQTQDSVIGGYLLTQDEIKMDQIFVARLHKNGRLVIDQLKYADDEGMTSGKDCLSLNFPNLSYKENTKYYNKEYARFIEYKTSDQKLDIQLGRIKTGYFDANANQYQKTIALTFNPTTALNTIFSIQQTILNSNMYTGLSVGFKELLSVNQEKINKMREQMIIKGYEVMQQYNDNLYGSQLDKSAYDEFQDKLRNCFMNDGLEFIMEAAGISGNKLKNNLMKLSITGSKGSIPNMRNMFVLIGKISVDGEPLKPLFHNRINMFFKRNDINPISKGIVMNSYLSGLTPSELLINATTERVQMLTKVLSVAKPGALGRKLIKNTENIIISNNRYVCKPNAIYQDLFGLDGFGVQYLSDFKIPMFYSTDQEFKEWFMSTLPKDINPGNTTKGQVYKLLEQHVTDISHMLIEVKVALCRAQLVNNQLDMKEHLQIPVTLNNMVETHIQQIMQDDGEQSTENLIQNIQILRKYCANLKYIYFNQQVQNLKLQVPDSYIHGIKNLKIALLCIFTFDKLSLFTPQQLHYFLETVSLLAKEALMSSGSAIGVLSAQAFQEYFTQDMLDAIHNVKGQGIQIDPLDKIIDLFNNRTPQNLASLNKPQPLIKIPLLIKEGQSIEEQRQRAKEIANKIKVITIRNLLTKWEIIMASIEKDNEPNFIEDKEMLEQVQIPPDFSTWCFRVVLDKNKMFLSNIVIDEIKNAIETHNNMIVVTHQNNTLSRDHIIIRMYLGPSIQFNSAIELRNQMEDFLDFNIRGIRGILDTSVYKETIPVFDTHLQQVVKKDRLVIYTEGSNLRDIMRQQLKYKHDIDFNSITCDNHTVIMEFFGKSAAQQKITNQIKGIFGKKVDPRHITFIASVMIQQGYLSILESDGIRKRNKDAPLISMTESRAVINLINACVQNQVSNIQSLSDNTMLGQVSSQAGTNFNKLLLNTDFLTQIKKDDKDIFDI